jgi:regulator of sigma E protease
MFEFLGQYSAFWAVFYAFAFLIALSVIVFIHEQGHFLVGRWCGVRAEVFAVGFGREIIGFTDKFGTRWKFGWLPLGGYVKFEGDADATSRPDFKSNSTHSPTSFPGAAVWKRMLIVLAGPAANFLTALVIFWSAFVFIGTSYLEPVVDEIIANSAAEKAGLKPGDRIVSVSGEEMASFEDVKRAVFLHAGDELDIGVLRDGQTVKLKITPDTSMQADSFGGTMKVGLLGVKHIARQDEPKTRFHSPVEAVGEAASQTWYVVKTTFKFIGKIFSGSQSVKQIGGPISIAKGAGDTAANGPMAFAMFLGFLSISIGLINLFPVPMLDGGHLVFYAIEAVRGKPLGQTAQEWGYRIGLSFVALLMMVGMFNDSGRLLNTIFGT